MAHTKGPWVVFGDWGIKDTDGRIIATFEALNDDLSNANTDESFANAELIAAAPDLLEERDKLKAINAELLEAIEFVSSIDINGADDRVVRLLFRSAQLRVRAAIAKAEGL